MTARRAARSPRLASVIIRSTRPRTSLAFASVVWTRSYRRTETVKVLEEGQAWTLLAAELAAVDPMGHRSGLLRSQIVELLFDLFDLVEIVAERRLFALGQDEAAHPQPLLHLVERLLAEVAHAQQVIVGELKQLPTLTMLLRLSEL